MSVAFRSLFSVIIFIIIVTSTLVYAQEPVDYVMVGKMRDEGFSRSQVMELVWYMTDVYGPRLGNSPSYNQAAEWAKNKFQEFGAKNVKLDPYAEIGMPWECTFSAVHLHKPQYMPLIAYPVSHTRGTNGKVIEEAVYINMEEITSESDLQKYRGRLGGKIVFTKPKPTLELDFKPRATRLSKAVLDDMAEMRITPPEETVTISREEYRTLRQGKVSPKPLPAEQINAFFEKEGVAVLVEPSMVKSRLDGPFDKGIVYLRSGRPVPLGGHKPLPRITMAAEHYNRIVRLLEKGMYEWERHGEAHIRSVDKTVLRCGHDTSGLR